MIVPNTLIAVRIHMVNVRNGCLISAIDVNGTILCVDRVDRIDRNH